MAVLSWLLKLAQLKPEINCLRMQRSCFQTLTECHVLLLLLTSRKKTRKREQPQGAGSEEIQDGKTEERSDNGCVQKQQPAFTWRLTNSEIWEYIHTQQIDGVAQFVLDCHKE